MTCSPETPCLTEMPESEWNIDSTLVPEKKMHLVEVSVLSLVLIAVGVLLPYMVTATVEVIASEAEHVRQAALTLVDKI